MRRKLHVRFGGRLIVTNRNGAGSRPNYQPHVDFAFNSVEHIMRDVNSG